MKQEEQLINKFGKDSGMKVPEGYFNTLEQQIMQSLPPYPEASKSIVLSRWQRVKPYVYMAAMFCGIWLMMKVFHTATQPISLSLDNPPEALVELIDGDTFYDINYLHYNIGEFDADEQEIIMSYDNIEDFEKDFYAAE
ncbi:MAG: hypothetical protein J1F38_00065 [Muribaculaceae bacterium]|nr:hypothetical protein [Muribaculaceae bacterium]